jgi:hypothetical protein
MRICAKESLVTRTFLPGLVLAFTVLKRFVTRYAVKIKENAGEGLYAIIELVIDLALLVLGLMSGNSNDEGDFLSPMDTLSSAQINLVRAAVVKYKTTAGVTEAW